MIVSEFEYTCINAFLGAVLDATNARRISFDDPALAHLSAWMQHPGITVAAQAEINAGEPIRSH